MSDEQNKAFLEQLSSEYKILQDKIDKIGTFRFTIRGWSVTLVAASIVTAGSTKLVTPYFVLLLIIFISLFALVESKQNGLGLRFGARSFQIERDIHRIIRNIGESTVLSEKTMTTDVDKKLPEPSQQKSRGSFGFAPRIAHSLRDAHRRSVQRNRLERLLDPSWRPDHFLLFYLFQGAAVVLTAFILLKLPPQGHPPAPTEGSTTVIEHHETGPEPAKATGNNASTGNSKTRRAEPPSH